MIPGAIILLGIIASLLFLLLPQQGFNRYPAIVGGITFALLACLVSFLQPCKDLLTNVSVSLNLLIISFLAVSTGLWWQDMQLKSEVLASWIITLSLLPHIFMMLCIFYYIVVWLKQHQFIIYSQVIVQFCSQVFSIICSQRERINNGLRETAAEDNHHDQETRSLLS